jgi:rubrerythrin
MSIVESLTKLVDPMVARAREEERKAEREKPKRESAGDPPRFACRVCGHEDEQSGYCPTCLADTMQRIPAGK